MIYCNGALNVIRRTIKLLCLEQHRQALHRQCKTLFDPLETQSDVFQDSRPVQHLALVDVDDVQRPLQVRALEVQRFNVPCHDLLANEQEQKAEADA